MTTITTPAVQVPEPLATTPLSRRRPQDRACSAATRSGAVTGTRAVPSGRLAHVVCIVRGAGTTSSTARLG
jgi:hypothetical protein